MRESTVDMIRAEEVYNIGRIGKTHGVKGEVTMQFTDDVFDAVDADFLVLEVDGILVPFFIEEYRMRSDSVAIMKFCDVDTQERASELTGCGVFFPRSVADEVEQPSLAALVGYAITDAATHKSVGSIAAIDQQTANTLFVLDDGRLIPAVAHLIEHIDAKRQTIEMNIPDGLLEI